MRIADMCGVRLGVLAADDGTSAHASLGQKKYAKLAIDGGSSIHGLAIYVVEYECFGIGIAFFGVTRRPNQPRFSLLLISHR